METRNKAKHLDREWLYQKYIIENLSTTEIGKIVERNRNAVCRRLHDFDIPIRKQQSRREISCFNCGGPTKNPKYCSSSCSAQTNNKLFPKRNRTGIPSKYNKKRSERVCPVCMSNLCEKYKKLCSACILIYAEKTKLCDLSGKENMILLNFKGNKYSIKAIICSLARQKFAKCRPHIVYCERCGYDKHYEIHHIKQRSSFDNTSLMGEINDISNLMALCRNCHWEEHHLKN